MDGLFPTHRATYTGRHSDLVYGQVYDVEVCANGGYFRCVSTSGRMLRTPVARWKDVHNLAVITVSKAAHATIRSDDGRLFGSSRDIHSIQTRQSDKDFFDQMIQGGDFLVGGGKSISTKDIPDAPAYKHQNATRKVNEVFKDSPSTEQLRKYRFTPEE